MSLRKYKRFFEKVREEREKLTFLHILVIVPDVVFAYFSAKIAGYWANWCAVRLGFAFYLPALAELGFEIAGGFCWFVLSRNVYAALARLVGLFIPVLKGKGMGYWFFSTLSKYLANRGNAVRDGPGGWIASYLHQINNIEERS
ncbi:MAG: hypothetical protein ACLQF0_05640 [Dissulfurispiraceae bacterium]